MGVANTGEDGRDTVDKGVGEGQAKRVEIRGDGEGDARRPEASLRFRSSPSPNRGGVCRIPGDVRGSCCTRPRDRWRARCALSPCRVG